MTVESRETAVELVEECEGKAAVYSYSHIETNKPLWAVFTDVAHIDIYQSPYVKDVTLCYDGLDAPSPRMEYYQSDTWIDIEGRLERFIAKVKKLPPLVIWSETEEGININNVNPLWYMGPVLRRGGYMVYWGDSSAQSLQFRRFETEKEAQHVVNQIRESVSGSDLSPFVK